MNFPQWGSILTLLCTQPRIGSSQPLGIHLARSTGNLRHFRYPFTTEDLDYVTATQIPLYLSQLTYILLGAAIQRRDFQEAVGDVLERYFHQMQAGRLFFVDVKQTMKRPMWKTEPLIATLQIDSTRRLRNTGIVFVSYSINDGACYGDLKTAMEFPE